MILTRLKQIIEDLSPSERKVAQYILDNPKEIEKYKKLAQERSEFFKIDSQIKEIEELFEE